MEALAAIGLATNVIAFVDFSANLLKGAKEVSSKGSLSELDSIQDGTIRLQRFIGQLAAPTGLSGTVAAKDLGSLANECAALADEMVKILNEIYATSHKYSRLNDARISWRAMKRRGKLESIQRRLDSYRKSIVEQITFMIRQDQMSMSTLPEDISKRHDKTTQQLRTQLGSLQAELVAALDKSQSDTAQSQRDVVGLLQDVKSKLENLVSVDREAERINSILDKLWFDDMLSREVSVRNASGVSYCWILEPTVQSEVSDESSGEDSEEELGEDESDTESDEEEPDKYHVEELDRQEVARSHFNRWLTSESGVFHISGKAGSGKSTLMKFLARSRHTRMQLQIWAASRGRPLILLSFFFWISGSQLQRSVEGLYRTILWEVLKQCPDLIPDVFPSRWESVDDQGSRISHLPLSLAEAKEAFERFREVVVERYALCLFIDGLDEYDGDHWKLGNYFASWKSEYVKICVSARPYNGFQQTLPLDPSRHFELHELNRGDMKCYVESELLEDERFCRLQNQDRIATDRIFAYLIGHAEGVFLWTVLAIKSVLGGITNGYTARQLLRLLINDIPSGLDAMFSKMLDGIPHAERKQAAISLLVVSDPQIRTAAYYYAKNLIFHWYIERIVQSSSCHNLIQNAETYHPSFRPNLQPPSFELIEAARARLNSRCAGFISCKGVDKGYDFQITHRTLGDFLRTARIRASLNELAADIDFPALVGKAFLNIMQDFSSPQTKLHRSWPDFWGTAHYLITIAERSTGHSTVIDKMMLSIFDLPNTAPNICLRTDVINGSGYAHIVSFRYSSPICRSGFGSATDIRTYEHRLALLLFERIMDKNWNFIARAKEQVIGLLPENFRTSFLLVTVANINSFKDKDVEKAFDFAKFLLELGVDLNVPIRGTVFLKSGLCQFGYTVDNNCMDKIGSVKKEFIGSGPSLWELFLQAASSRVLSRTETPSQSFFNIIELFLAHGAKPNMWFIVSHLRSSCGYGSGFDVPAKLDRISLRQLVEACKPFNAGEIFRYLQKTKSNFPWPFASALRNSKIPGLANDELHRSLAPLVVMDACCLMNLGKDIAFACEYDQDGWAGKGPLYFAKESKGPKRFVTQWSLCFA